jgi:hypothetical protein
MPVFLSGRSDCILGKFRKDELMEPLSGGEITPHFSKDTSAELTKLAA